ncbi:hypothetical protein YC2023_081557 [Brassica napus]
MSMKELVQQPGRESVTPRLPTDNGPPTPALSARGLHPVPTVGALIFQSLKVLFTDPTITIRPFPVLWPHFHGITNHFPIGHPSFHYSSPSVLNSGVLNGCMTEKALSVTNSTNKQSDSGGKIANVPNLGWRSLSSQELQLITTNEDNPINDFTLLKSTHTNKHTGEIVIWLRRRSSSCLTREQLSNLFLELFEREGRFVLQQRGLLLRFTVLNPYQQAHRRNHDLVTKEVIQLLFEREGRFVLQQRGLLLRFTVLNPYQQAHWRNHDLVTKEVIQLLFEREGRFVLQQRGLLLRFTVLTPPPPPPPPHPIELFEREGRFVLQQRGLLLRFTVLTPPPHPIEDVPDEESQFLKNDNADI